MLVVAACCLICMSNYPSTASGKICLSTGEKLLNVSCDNWLWTENEVIIMEDSKDSTGLFFSLSQLKLNYLMSFSFFICELRISFNCDNAISINLKVFKHLLRCLKLYKMAKCWETGGRNSACEFSVFLSYVNFYMVYTIRSGDFKVLARLSVWKRSSF